MNPRSLTPSSETNRPIYITQSPARLTQRGTGPALVGSGTKGGRTRGEGSGRFERIGSAETGSGGASLETDDGFAGMDRGKAIDAQRGERESAVVPAGSKKNPGQLTARDAEFPEKCPEKRNVISVLSEFAP